MTSWAFYLLSNFKARDLQNLIGQIAIDERHI